MRLVGRVAVGVGLDADDRPVRDLRLRGGLDLRRGIAREERLVASLVAPRVLRVGAAEGAAATACAATLLVLEEPEPEPLAALAIP